MLLLTLLGFRSVKSLLCVKGELAVREEKLFGVGGLCVFSKGRYTYLYCRLAGNSSLIFIYFVLFILNFGDGMLMTQREQLLFCSARDRPSDSL